MEKFLKIIYHYITYITIMEYIFNNYRVEKQLTYCKIKHSPSHLASRQACNTLESYLTFLLSTTPPPLHDHSSTCDIQVERWCNKC